MRVLYVSHTSLVSGAERSLLDTIQATRAHVDVVLACPEGDLRGRAQALGIPTLLLQPLQVSFRSGFRELLSAAFGLVREGRRVRRLARENHVEVLHAASARAGLIVMLAGPGGPRRIVDVRDALPRGAKGALVRWLLRLSAETLVFNSEFIKGRFGATRPANALVSYPPINLEPFLRLQLRSGAEELVAPVLGVIGQLTPWKGQDDAIRILALLREQSPDARLRMVGSVVFSGEGHTFGNEAYAASLMELATELGVAHAVDFVAATDDLESVFESLDILLVPSWAEPFGRVVAEAMAAGVPVVAWDRGGPRELLEDGRTGFLVPGSSLAAWLIPITSLLDDPMLRARITRSARLQVSRVLNGQSAARILNRYVDAATTTARAVRRRDTADPHAERPKGFERT